MRPIEFDLAGYKWFVPPVKDWLTELNSVEQFPREKYAMEDISWPEHTTGHITKPVTRSVFDYYRVCKNIALGQLTEANLPTTGQFRLRILKYPPSPDRTSGGLHRDINYCTWNIYCSLRTSPSFYWGLQAERLGAHRATPHMFRANKSFERVTAVMFYSLPLEGFLDSVGYKLPIIVQDGVEGFADPVTGDWRPNIDHIINEKEKQSAPF
jgi:hypothetical protein